MPKRKAKRSKTKTKTLGGLRMGECKNVKGRKGIKFCRTGKGPTGFQFKRKK